MGLQLYNQKRDFTKTPEPTGKIASKKGHSFCVQKHDATRLHYDFRLELDGVLLSWAVTKGPSLHPSDKRLAVRTEDHPLSYGDFEGIIPKGQYGGGTVMLWDTGSWEPKGDPRAGLEKGHLSFSLSGQRLKGEWALIRMRGKAGEKRENWLLVKENDDEAVDSETEAIDFLERSASSVKTGRAMGEIAQGDTVWKRGKAVIEELQTKAVKPGKNAKKITSLKSLQGHYKTVQLATLVTEPPQGGDWIHEIKYDGYRILCFVAGGAVKIVTRNGNDWTGRFPRVVQALESLNVDSAVLDGEAVLLDGNGVSNFGDLQEALSEGGEPSDIQAYFFDLLHLNGEDLSQKTLLERKDKLEILLQSADPHIHYSEHMSGEKAMLEKVCGMGLEGLISKKAQGKYVQGRTKAWLKSKCNKRQEFVIVGYTRAKSGGRVIGALHLAYASGKELKYAGKVGTGFGVAMAKRIFDILEPLTVKKVPIQGLARLAQRNSFWVDPKILCEVSFAEWTRDGHVRHGSFEGLRQDKAPKDVMRETPQNTGKILKASATKEDAPEEPASGAKPKASSKNAPLIVRGITVSHPEREVFDDVDITKGQLVQYYGAVAPHILKQIRNHPISLLRCPSGTDAECFFQRNPDAHMKKHVKSFTWLHKGKKHEYLYVENEEGLVYLIQMGVIEIHPWGAPVNRIDYPDRMIFDLDPDPAVPFEAVKLAARDIRQRLSRQGYKNIMLKCSGGKGLHVTALLDGKRKWPEVKAFARLFSEELAHEVPDAYVATMTKTKRTGKIFIDYFRNDYTATAIADYAVRARPGAPVAVPLDWDELDDLKSASQFSMQDVLKRLDLKLG